MVLGRGTRWLAGSMTLACVVLMGPSAPSGALGTSQSAEAVGDIVTNRVLTWNLCNPCDTSNVDRAAEIAALAPQVVGLQEACTRDVDRIREYLENLYGLTYHVAHGPVLRNMGRCGGTPWSPGAYGQAILSAAPMSDRVVVEYPDGGSEDRGYMAVTTLVDGRPLRVFNTHLAQRRQEAVRADQAGLLAADIARHDRALVLGDFNAVPEAPELTRIWALATDTDAQCRPTRTAMCRPTTDWQTKFDYVFLRGMLPLRHKVHPTPHSDHHLLHTDLDLDLRS